MARFKGKFIVGSIGPVTYKRSKTGGTISSRVKDVKQTEATKQSAKFFGGVSSFARVLRSNMVSVGNQDTTLMTRLNKEMLAVLLQCYSKETKTFNFSNTYFSRLNGIEFNIDSPLKSYLWPMPAVVLHENQVIVSIPEIITAENLVFPPGSTHCQLQIQPMQYDLNGGHFKRMGAAKLMIKRSDEIFQAQDLVFDVVPGTLCVVALGLHYFKVEGDIHIMLNTPEFSPSAFLYAMFNDGVFAEKLEEVIVTEVDGGQMGRKVVYWTDCHRGFPVSKHGSNIPDLIPGIELIQ